MVSAVFSNKKNAPVIVKSQNHGVKTMVFDREDFYEKNTVLNKLNDIDPDLIVLAGFLWIIPDSLLRNFPDKIINIHPALLPKYGGKGMYGMNVHRAVKEKKEPETGISIHFVNEKYDEGEIIFQARTSVAPQDTIETIAEKIHQLEQKHFPEVIEKILIDGK